MQPARLLAPPSASQRSTEEQGQEMRGATTARSGPTGLFAPNTAGCLPLTQSGGVVMNPVDHPMGGGEGKSSGGRHPCTPWGIPTKGHKTRKNKSTDKYIVKRRG